MALMSLPPRGNDHGHPAGKMLNLPSLRELGLWESAQSRPASPQDLGRPQLSTLSPLPQFQPMNYEGGRQPWQQQTYPQHGRSDSRTYNTAVPAYRDTSSRTAHIFASKPQLKLDQQDVFEEYSAARDRRHEWRRDSAASISSTPSLGGSFASCTSSADGTSPAPTPSTPQDSSALWDLGGKEYCLSQNSDSETWSMPLVRNPLSAKIPRRNPHKSSLSPRLDAQQSAYKIQKRPRAKPKNTGQAHCNEKYTTEEDRFLVYFRVDHPMAWSQLETAFNQRFYRDGRRPWRTDGGLQSQFYRLNKDCPVLTDDNLPTFGPRSMAEALAHNYDEYDMMTADHPVRVSKVSLIDRYAEQIVEERWEWITEEDMAEARRLADLRRPHRLAWEAYKTIHPLPTKAEIEAARAALAKAKQEAGRS